MHSCHPVVVRARLAAKILLAVAIIVIVVPCHAEQQLSHEAEERCSTNT